MALIFIDFQSPVSCDYNPYTRKNQDQKSDGETDGQTDTTDRSTYPANAVVNSDTVQLLYPETTSLQ